MKSQNVVAFAVAAILCVAPVSLRWSHGDDISSLSLSAAFSSAEAADLNLPRHGSLRSSFEIGTLAGHRILQAPRRVQPCPS